jgi:hypothetical protein
VNEIEKENFTQCQSIDSVEIKFSQLLIIGFFAYLIPGTRTNVDILQKEKERMDEK